MLYSRHGALEQLEDALATLGAVLQERGHSTPRPTSSPSSSRRRCVRSGTPLGLAGTWLNIGPAGLIDFGLPPGLDGRVTVRRYGTLDVHVPAREDLICFKLYAAVDQGERSKHFADLQRMQPTTDELLVAARWARTPDSSPGFAGELRRILDVLGVERHDGDL